MSDAVYAVEVQCESACSAAIQELLAKAVRRVLSQRQHPPCEVSVLITSDAQIQELNGEYRGKNEPTDVLSFPMDDDPDIEGAPRFLGDIVISLERAIEQAEDYGHSVEREVAFLAVHGTLHLLGYDHDSEAGEAEMRALEEETLRGLGLPRE